MNFDDERFVKIYPRNTTNWKLLGWEGRCVLMMLLREVDRAGCLDIDGGMEGLALLLDLPPDVTERGFASCVKRGSVVQNGNTAIIPNFVKAQEARQTDRVRQAESRARRRELGMMSQNVTHVARTVTECDQTSRAVTASHTASHDVTLRLEQTRPEQNNTSCAKPEPSQPELALVPQQAAESKQPKAQVIAQIAVTLFGELQAARKRCNPNVRCEVRKVLPMHTREIERCLREELTVDDLRHVIAVWEAQVKSGRQDMAHFDSVTPFRAANVAKYLQMSLDDARKPRGQATQAMRPPEPPKSPQGTESDFQRRRKELEAAQ